ncbi:MAG: sugar phosphate isomerase/epimerase [Caldilinea sp. CFX5]|nr:sugar phosphate isomerase/epimerase [Caldilinea sp. CFX5]
MKLAVSSYEFKTLSFLELLRLLKTLEVGYLELWPESVANESLADAQRLLDEFGIQVSCVSARSQYRLNSEDVAQAQGAIFKALDLASALGARYVTTYLGGNPTRNFYTTLQLYRRNLQPCLAEAASRGMTILLENMFDNRGEDPGGTMPARHAGGMRAICEAIQSPHFGVTYDPANFYIAGGEPFPLPFDLFGKWVANVHIKDAKRYVEWLHGDRQSLPLWTDSSNGPFLSVPVGQGALPWARILRHLRTVTFPGFLTVDILTTPATYADAYRESVAEIRRLMEE